MFLHIAAIVFCCPIILCFALPTCKVTEIEVSNSVYCMVMVKFTRTKKKNMGVPNFMEGSLIPYEIGDPGVPKILENWGPGSPISYENGDPGFPFGGVPIFT